MFIYLLLLNVKKYGISEILEPFVAELQSLERNKGVKVVINYKEYVLRASLIAFIGDTLAAHLALGILGPGAKHFCHLCTISRDDIPMNTFLPDNLRTKDVPDSHIQLISVSDKNKTLTGVRENSVLNELKYFNTSMNYVLDHLHDFWEGQFMYATKSIVGKILMEKKFNMNVEKLHSRIKLFDYGDTETRNKLSRTFTMSSLKNSKNHKLQ